MSTSSFVIEPFCDDLAVCSRRRDLGFVLPVSRFLKR
jgi:hypothetical protein